MQSMDGWEKQPKAKRFPGYGLQRWWARTGTEWAQEIVEIDEGLPL